MAIINDANDDAVEMSDIKILIMDDNENLCQMISELVRRIGMDADYETTIHDGLKTLEKTPYDIVLLDVNMPDGCGLDIIPDLRKGSDPPEIIIITGHGDEESAEIAIRNYVWDYIPKDASLQNLKLSLRRAVQYRRQKRKFSPVLKLKRDGIIGNGPTISACLEKASRAAVSENPVLILGQTGTGKEVFAKTIHENSSRAKNDFVVVDCSALPDHLVESILFGHKRGAFTSADSDRIGLVEQANGGTLFLDEIGELPEEIQKKFLRVLQEKRFRALGGKTEEKSDFRLICATHQDLTKMVEEGRFREDLYFRIRSIVVNLPALRERPEDIPDLIGYYMERQCELTGVCLREVSSEFIEALQTYSWPGNIRELFNTLDCMNAEVSQGSELFSRHLPVHIRSEVAKNRIRASIRVTNGKEPSENGEDVKNMMPMKEFLEEKRAEYVDNLMSASGWNVPEACRISKLSRGHLYDLLKKYRIEH